MKENEMRDSIAKRDLNKEDCDDEKVHQFLMLLKISKTLMPINEDFNAGK